MLRNNAGHVPLTTSSIIWTVMLCGWEVGMCGMDFSSSVRFEKTAVSVRLRKNRRFGFLCRLVVKYTKNV